MSKTRSISVFGLSILICALGALAAYSQPPNKKKVDKDPTEKPIHAKSEIIDAHKKWLAEAKYTITAEERTAFLKLRTAEERENFIESFWDRRDPNPDTEENEFREEYYERIAYANEHFASGIPGWLTDRGRIYITWGKPDSIESHPSGGAYDRPSYEGGGSTTTYPFETWFYRHLDNVGDGIEIEFVDRTGTGEYRISRDATDKVALITIPGVNDKQTVGSNYVREQDNPLIVAQRIKDLETPPKVQFTDLAGTSIDSPVVDNNPLNFDLRIDYFRQSEDRVITAFTVQTNNKDLKFDPAGGLETATINIFGRVTAVAGKRSGIFEDSITTNATTDELTTVKGRKSIYQKAIALTPGTYKVDVVVRDVVTGNKGIVQMGFTVPRYDEKKLSTSSLVLASTLRPTDDGDTGARFTIGNTKLIPNLSGVFRQGQPLGVYMQIYNAQIDQTTLRPAVDVDYVFLKNGVEVDRKKENWIGLSDSGQRLTLARLLPTDSMPAGDYEIKIEIRDRTRADQKIIENTGKFTITK